MAEVTVPGYLLPGLLREDLRVTIVRPGAAVDGDTAMVLHFEDGLWRVWALRERGLFYIEPHEAIVDIARRAGWDAGVDALARHFWPDMAPHDRAVFCSIAHTWMLFTPGQLGQSRIWPSIATSDPVAALRAAIIYEAGGPRWPTPSLP